VPQGISADLIASQDGFSRSELDQYALESHRKAAKAQQAGYFRSLFALVKGEDGAPLLTEEDHIRPDATLAALEQLPPAFAKLGDELASQGIIGADKPIPRVTPVHTAGTSSGIADGASALLIANGAFVKEFNLKPRARIIGTHAEGSDPVSMLRGPSGCCLQLLKSCGMSVQDVDLWEINEAFAVVPLETIRKLAIDPARVNIMGGAIAKGHPLGATGAILLASLITELERENRSIGCVTLCVAGGQSVATLVERC
jgi:acetyl-CoA C-acetyltransferase